MDIYQKLVENSLSLARAKKAKRVCIGINYTMVEIERGGTGIANTLLPDWEIYRNSENEVDFWKSPADLLIKGYLSNNPLEISVGLAAINAILNNKKNSLFNTFKGDIFSQLNLSGKDEVLMIGYFESIYNKLKGKVKKIWVIEKIWGNSHFNISETIHKIKLAIITSSTLLNKTLENFLEITKEIPEVLLIGPSTPLKPEIFKNTPITWLCGSIVKDPELLFRSICEGKGAKSFFKSGALEKINLKIK